MSTLYVSGQAGRGAIVAEDGLITSLDRGSGAEPGVWTDVLTLLLYPDLSILASATSIDPMAQVERVANVESARVLLLCLFDETYSDALRAEVAATLDVKLNDSQTRLELARLAANWPLEGDANFASALEAAEVAKADSVGEFVRGIKSRGELIRRVWRALEVELFGVGTEVGVSVAEWFARRGGVLAATQAVIESRPSRFGEWIVANAADTPGFSPPQAVRLFAAIQNKLIPVAAEQPADDDVDVDDEPSRAAGQAHPGGGRSAQKAVFAQVAQVRQAIAAGELERARRWTADLVRYQVDRDRPELVTKSLCSIATDARSLGRNEFAREILLAALQIAPDDRWTWRQLIDLLRATESYDEALAATVEASDRFPNDPYTLNDRAALLLAKQDYDGALRAFDTLLVRNPSDPVTVNGHATVLREMGRFDEALAEYDAALHAGVLDVGLLNGRASTLAHAGKLAEALASYEETIQIYPGDSVAYGGLAEVLEAQGLYAHSLAQYERAHAIFPTSRVALVGLAGALKLLGRYDEALDIFERESRVAPADKVMWSGWADTLRTAGRLEEAVRVYDEAIQTYPRNVRLRKGKSAVLRGLGRPESALAELDALGEWASRSVRTERAQVLLMLGRIDDAISTLEDGPPRTMDDWVQYHALGMAYLRANRLEDALAVFERGSENVPWALTRDYHRTALASTLIRLRRFHRAVTHLEPEVGRMASPQSVASRLLLVHAWGELGDVGKARSWQIPLSQSVSRQASELQSLLVRRYVKGDTVPDRLIADREMLLLAA